MKVTWPDIFTNPDYRLINADSDFARATACADGLMGWALCYLEKRPENFGEGMAKIAAFLDIPANHKAMMEYSKGLRLK